MIDNKLTIAKEDGRRQSRDECIDFPEYRQGIVAAQTGSNRPAGSGQLQVRRCPLWVKSRHRGTSGQCPLYPQKRTLEISHGMSALCQKQTHALQQNASYSITSSAATSRPGDTVRPRALAALRLRAVSYFVGVCTGSSAG